MRIYIGISICIDNDIHKHIITHIHMFIRIDIHMRTWHYIFTYRSIYITSGRQPGG